MGEWFVIDGKRVVRAYETANEAYAFRQGYGRGIVVATPRAVERELSLGERGPARSRE